PLGRVLRGDERRLRVAVERELADVRSAGGEGGCDDHRDRLRWIGDNSRIGKGHSDQEQQAIHVRFSGVRSEFTQTANEVHENVEKLTTPRPPSATGPAAPSRGVLSSG